MGGRIPMKALVVFDTTHGNTKKIADAIAQGISDDTRTVRASEFEKKDIEGIDLLVIGSPTVDGRPTEQIQQLAISLRGRASGIRIATFDTRLKMRFGKLHGYAAERIADQLCESGAIIKARPEGFIVTGRNGPLANGELERAKSWAAKTLSK
jgi:flavodoxin